MKLPEYVTTEEINITIGLNRTFTLPAHSFVQPIHLAYVPKHVLDNQWYKSRNMLTEFFCYTHFGILLLERRKVRQL